MATKDTLGHAIAQVMRRTIPQHTLCNVPPADKVLLQNIVHLVQDAIPEVDVTQMELDKSADQYSIRLPFSAHTFMISLEQLRQIQTYSPARISDVLVGSSAEAPQLTIRVTTEAKPLLFSEIDIIRIRKRRCIQ
jgi:hypothetical protein